VSLLVIATFLILAVASQIFHWGVIVDYGYQIRVVLRSADGKPIDPVAVSLTSPDEKTWRPDEKRWHDRWNPLAKMRQPEGAYGFMGIGPICWGKDCDAQWEIRAVGYKPFAFKMADHCAGWHEKGCLRLDVTATLTPDPLQQPWPID
jgi:hypothetical protein